jgi:peptide/nickel transport system permease protein
MTEGVAMATAVDQAERPPRSQWLDVWDQFKTHKGALLGAAVFISILLFVTVGPWLWSTDPGYANLRMRNQAPSLQFPFGTDQLGRDLFARMMAGGQVSIAVGLTAMAIAVLLGTLIGVTAGFFAAWTAS